jgi:dephospho-CoA kinase
MTSKPLIIGLTGPNAAGKGEAAAALVSLGFAYHSLSDVVREEAVARGRSTGRDDLILTGNELRREGGAGVLAARMVPRLGLRDVVDSIRNPAEVEVLRGVPGFVLLGIDAPVALRFERARRRTGRGDAIASLEAFIRKESEENTTDPTAQRLAATFELADHVVHNDETLERFRLRIMDLVAKLDR